ncbi:ATP-binding protein, partial [Pseudomonas syringae]|uniref:ATP-binding protein n=1 Tax=Pseudomonas syringae TaxID=317 RepID=UPI000C5EF31C
MKLNMVINKIKSISNLEIDLPVVKGSYAITGQNGSGKSTLVTCASTVFFNMRMKDYLGVTDEDSYISFELNGAKQSWRKNRKGKWAKSSVGDMVLKGFYERSIIYGTRFRNASYHILLQIEKIDGDKLTLADDFIRENLGKILHNNKNFYERVLKINSNDAGP